MRNIDDTHSLASQLLNHSKQLINLRIRKRRSRLIHYEYLRFIRKRFRNFDHLLLCDCQLRYERSRVQLQIHMPEQLLRSLIHRIVVEK
ncbi:hypothetical protein D3C78_1568900 [compost metagenome]